MILSSLICISLKRGMALLMIMAIRAIITGITTTIHKDSGLSLETAMIIPPIHIIGALTIMRNIMKVTVCIWLMSLVVRVINVAVPISLNSCNEKSSTREKTLLRSILPNPTEVRADKKLAVIAQTVPSAVMSSISPPIFMI